MEKGTGSLRDRIEQLERENDRLKTINQIMLIEKSQWTTSKEKFDLIVQQTISGANVKNATISEEMRLIREENRRLKVDVKQFKYG